MFQEGVTVGRLTALFKLVPFISQIARPARCSVCLAATIKIAGTYLYSRTPPPFPTNAKKRAAFNGHIVRKYFSRTPGT